MIPEFTIGPRQETAGTGEGEDWFATEAQRTQRKNLAVYCACGAINNKQLCALCASVAKKFLFLTVSPVLLAFTIWRQYADQFSTAPGEET